MKRYRAHYASPRGADPVNGTFEFESASNAGSKRNMHDARMKMLETFGKEAVAWRIDRVELVGKGEASEFVQMQLDFREPKKPSVRHKVERGKVPKS
jgi:hypothetical protein